MVSELVKVAIIEERVVTTFSEAFLNLFDETSKKKMYQLAMESAEHYDMLKSAVSGLEEYKTKYKDYFIGPSPFKLEKKSMKQILEDQLTLEKIAIGNYKSILKILNELSEDKRIVRKGLRIAPDELKLVCTKILKTKQGHISLVEKILDVYADMFVEPSG